MTNTGLQREQLVAWLRRRDPAKPVTTIETHISILAFQSDRVYKLKKAVTYPFVDLSTPAQRLADCEREVTLNRRLAPDVYLGVEAITEGNAVVDHVVAMRRMPDTRRLASPALHEADAAECVDRVAALIARFHARAATSEIIDAAATRDGVSRAWEQELAQTARYEGSTFPADVSAHIALLSRRYLAGRAPLFDARVAAGHARDGHGDLLADDIFCLPDGPRVLDCLEFDELLRYGDVLADVAFLAMDLERLGRSDLARRFLDGYRDHTSDDWPRSLEHFYIAYRAHVRAKIAAIDGNAQRARQLLSLADEHLDTGRVRLVLVGGPPATGKTTVARAIERETGWLLLRSDEIRKELAGITTIRAARAPLDEGIYTPSWTDRTYATLCDRARDSLANGRPVVLDASFQDPRWRAAAARVADETSSDLVAFCCTTRLDVAIERAARRAATHTDASDADAGIATVSAARFTPWPEARALDTTATPVDAVAATAVTALGRF
jgi:hypothetical protein